MIASRQARFSLAAAVLFAVFAALAVSDASRLDRLLPWRQMYDFVDFYCGGRVVADGGDPYRYAPLHDCERKFGGDQYRADPARVVPMVLPTYAFPGLAALGRMQFDVARTRFAVFNVGATVVSMAVLAVIGIDLTLAIAALLLSAGYLLLAAGQVVPFTLLALVLCGWALHKRHPVAAGIFASLGLIEPHLSLPVCAAVFLFGGNRARISLAIAVGALAVIAATAGHALNWEYLTRVLPGQTLADAHSPYQYSLTYLLSVFGAPPKVTLYAGDASYAVLALAGIWLGKKLSERLNRPEMIAFAPAAAVVLAGPYMHAVELCFAVPASLVIATNARGRARTIAAATLCILATPWIATTYSPHFFLISVLVCAVILWRLHVPLMPAAVVLAAFAIMLFGFESSPGAFTWGTGPLRTAPDELSVTAWQDIISGTSAPVAPWLAIKIPTWAALCATLGLAWWMARGSEKPSCS